MEEICRGEIYWIYEGAKQDVGSEQMKARPAVVVSNDIGGNQDTATVVWLTTAPKRPLGVHHVIERTSTGNCEGDTALCEHITTVSTKRFGDYMARVSDEDMEAVDKAIMFALDLERYINAETPTIVHKVEKPKPKPEPAAVSQPKEDTAAKAEIMRLNMEVDFYRSQYEAMLGRIMQKAKL